MQRKEVRAVIEVIWQMNHSKWVSSVILSLRCRDTEFVRWSKSPDKSMILRLTLFNYFQSYPTKDKMHDRIEVTCYLDRSRCFNPNIFHSHRQKVELVSQSKSYNKWTIHLGSFHLFLPFRKKTHSSHCDLRLVSNTRCHISLFNYFAPCTKNTEISLLPKPHRIRKFRADSIQLLYHFQWKICTWYSDRYHVETEEIYVGLFNNFHRCLQTCLVSSVIEYHLRAAFSYLASSFIYSFKQKYTKCLEDN